MSTLHRKGETREKKVMIGEMEYPTVIIRDKKIRGSYHTIESKGVVHR